MMADLQKIVIVPDKFKGSLSSIEVSNAIREGILSENEGVDFHFDIVQIADGGDGSIEVIEDYLSREDVDYERVVCSAHNPLGELINTYYIIYKDTAFIEMAKVSGLVLISDILRNPMNTTTFGLGELIADAALRGVSKIFLSIGGSATNDCGFGMLQALGYRFYNSSGELLAGMICGGGLASVYEIVAPEGLNLPVIEVICDVDNPLCGEHGATFTYAPQKGASLEMLNLLERGVENVVRVGSGGAIAIVPGAGAAGGVGYAAMKYLKGVLVSGNEFFISLAGLEEKIKSADMVFTGEGKLDDQTLHGKVVSGVYKLCRKYDKKLVIVCGINTLPPDALPYAKIIALADYEPDPARSMRDAYSILARLPMNRF